jgi:hypothetical protein
MEIFAMLLDELNVCFSKATLTIERAIFANLISVGNFPLLSET